MKTERDIYMELFNISVNTYYLWKKQQRPIILLLDKYFTRGDLEEFLEKGKIEKLDFLSKIDSIFNSFSLEIEKKVKEKLKITNNDYSFFDFDGYVTSFFLKGEYDFDNMQLKVLKHISDDIKLSPDQKISYIAAISSLSKIEFYIISKELFLAK